MTAPNKEAIEAAARKMCDDHKGDGFYDHERTSEEFRDSYRRDAKSFLTAALPFLATQPTQGDEERAHHLVCELIAGGGTDEEAVAVALAFATAVRAEATLANAAAEMEALVEFGNHTNWSLEYVSKFYADDDEPKVDHWAVFEEHGSINDREWDEIGAGATPQEAIAAAIRTRK